MNKQAKFGVLVLSGVAMAALSGCKTITPGNVGIEVSKVGSSRGVQDLTIKTGFVMYNPALTEVIEYPTYVQTVKWTKTADEGKPTDESITFTTKDSLVVNADVSLSYQLSSEKAPAFYVKYRADDIVIFTDGYLRNVVRDSFNEIAGGYTVEEVMGDNGPILKRVRERIQNVLIPEGIDITQLGFIGAPRPPENITNAINSKVQAIQLTLQKQQEVAQEQAEALKREAQADGIAKANIRTAEGDAASNRLRNESLTPALLEWTKLQKWDGHNPSVVSGANGVIVNAGGK